MQDIIKRLRYWTAGPAPTFSEVADAIEHLCAENERLREALGRAPSIAASFGAALQGRNQSDYAQGYANACDTIEMVLTKLVSDTLAETEKMK